MREFRDQLSLSRPQLAALTGRSVNYILKAEQYTFPSPPVALVEYYHKTLALDRTILQTAYRSGQRLQRQAFHEHIRPRPTDTSAARFCGKWFYSGGSAVEVEKEFSGTDVVLIDKIELPKTSPNQYMMSKTLCLPASAIYFAEKTGQISASIHEAMDDLVQFANSGQLYAALDSYEQAQEIHAGLVRIKEELRG